MLLVIEVSEATLTFDLLRKARLYARHGVPELWVFDIAGGVVNVLREPTDEGYASAGEKRHGEVLVVPGFEEAPLAVDDVLG